MKPPKKIELFEIPDFLEHVEMKNPNEKLKKYPHYSFGYHCHFELKNLR